MATRKRPTKAELAQAKADEMVLDIRNHCMKGALQIRMQSQRKMDKDLSTEVAAQKQADEKSIRVSVLLIEGMEELSSLRSKAREYFNSMGAPWQHEGEILFKNAVIPDVMYKMAEYSSEFERLVDEFIANYDQLVEQAKNRLGATFSADNYQTDKDALRSKFGFAYSFDPLEDVTKIPMFEDKEIESILSESSKERAIAQMADAQMEGWDRLFQGVHHLLERLKAADENESSRLHESVLTNLSEICDSIPALNYADDPRLTEMGERVKSSILAFSRDELKNTESARKSVLDESQKVVDQLSEMFDINLEG